MTPIGKEYIAETILINENEVFNSSLTAKDPIYETVIFDQLNRPTKFTIKNFLGNHSYYITRFNGLFRRIIRIDNITEFIYVNSEFRRSAEKFDRLYLYINREDYLKELLLMDDKGHTITSDFLLFGKDCDMFGKFIQYKNRELGKKILSEIKKRRYTGRFV